MEIRVTCYSGYRGDESPRTIRFTSHSVAVADISDRWLAPEHRYFKCVGDEGDVYIIRQDMHTLDWELVYFEQAGEKGKVPE